MAFTEPLIFLFKAAVGKYQHNRRNDLPKLLSLRPYFYKYLLYLFENQTFLNYYPLLTKKSINRYVE